MPIVASQSIDDDGVRYQWCSEHGGLRHEGVIHWNQVAEVRVFKRDMFAYDLICLMLISDHGAVIELDEEDPNWERLVGTIPKKLEGALCWVDWFSEVAFPALAANERTIFKKATQGGQTAISDRDTPPTGIGA